MFRSVTNSARAIARQSNSSAVSSNVRRNLHHEVRQSRKSYSNIIGALAGAGTVAGSLIYLGGGSQFVHFNDAPISSSFNNIKQGSAQHAQVTDAMSNPGVYVWGDNSGGVIDPNSEEKIIKNPRRMTFFDGVVLRDLVLTNDVGAAVNDKGDVLLWGSKYDKVARKPEITLKGKNISQIALSQDMVIALSKDGSIYKFPISKTYQQANAKPKEGSWVPGMSGEAEIAYKKIKVPLGMMESVKDITAGADHLVLLTSAGRVFTSAVSFDYPVKGQLGIHGLNWHTRPKDQPVDVLHEVVGLKGHKITQIATGDNHTVALDDKGRVFAFGDNIHGQCGALFNSEQPYIDEPKEIPIQALYPARTPPKVTNIAAGGANSYFVTDIKDPESGRETVDVLASGRGIHGTLGNGLWTHSQGPPVKIKAVSGVFEYDEKAGKLAPIRIRDIHAGANHVAAVMANNTSTGTKDANFGRDVLWWGNNQFYQLGTGKRNNCNVPVYINALDPAVVPEKAGEFTGSSSRGGSTEDNRASGIIGRVDDKDSGRYTGKDQVHRFQLAPESKVKGKQAEQTVVCGKGNTAVFMKCAA